MPFSGLWGLPFTLRQGSSGAVIYRPGMALASETRASNATYNATLNQSGVSYLPGGSLTSETRASAATYNAAVGGRP